MKGHHGGRPPQDERLERALLVAVLDPPSYGRPEADLVRELGEPIARIWAAAWWLEGHGLVNVGNGHVHDERGHLVVDEQKRCSRRSTRRAT
jgi:hypothetical protein